MLVTCAGWLVPPPVSQEFLVSLGFHRAGSGRQSPSLSLSGLYFHILVSPFTQLLRVMRISQPGTDLMAPRHKEIKMLINCLYETIFRHFYILLEGIHDLLLSAVKSFYPFYGPAALDTEMTAQVSRAATGGHPRHVEPGTDLCNDGPDQGQLLLTSGPLCDRTVTM